MLLCEPPPLARVRNHAPRYGDATFTVTVLAQAAPRERRSTRLQKIRPLSRSLEKAVQFCKYLEMPLVTGFPGQPVAIIHDGPKSVKERPWGILPATEGLDTLL